MNEYCKWCEGVRQRKQVNEWVSNIQEGIPIKGTGGAVLSFRIYLE